MNIGDKPTMQDSLWTFIDTHYRARSVQQLVLSLQDELGLNVNMLFWCLWLQLKGFQLTPDTLRDTVLKVTPVHDRWVVPLRNLRRSAERGSDLYQAILAAEICAEKHFIETLAGFSDGIEWPPLKRNHDNLLVYMKHCGVNPKDMARVEELKQLIDR